MTEHIFGRLEDDWERAKQHFRHARPTISGEQMQPSQPPGAFVPLADTHADLKQASDHLRGTISECLTHLHSLDDLIGDVGEIAKIADSPLVVAAAGALHVPEPVLQSFVTGLEALARAFPKPEPAPEPAPADQPAADEQPEQPAA